MRKRGSQFELEVLPQPDDSTCGPTSLHAVYNYWGDAIPLDQAIAEVPPLPDGGTVAVSLACHALERGYEAEIYTYNLLMFDPTWFTGSVDLADRLTQQARLKPQKKLTHSTDLYLRFLELGGVIRYEELTTEWLAGLLEQGEPVLTGLSATYLYGCAREHNDEYDDVAGEPTGHFVVLCGYDHHDRTVMVADPLLDTPRFPSHNYSVGIDRVIASILLGIVTYDANLLLVRPKSA